MTSFKTAQISCICFIILVALAGFVEAGQASEIFWEEQDNYRRPPAPSPENGRTQTDVRPRFRTIGQRYSDYLQWLEDNYPDEAEELENLQQENPELFGRHLRISLRKYGEIFHADRENPELADLLKEDLRLKERRDYLLDKIRQEDIAAEDGEQLESQIRQVVAERFDVIVEIKQFRHDQLEQRLRRLQRDLRRRHRQLEIWQEQKEQKLEERMSELLEQKDPQFYWD